MGIPKFFGWFSHSEAFKVTILNRLPRDPIDGLFIDLNGIIHENAAREFGYGEGVPPVEPIVTEQDYFLRRQAVYRGTFSDIVTLCELIGPTTVLMLAIDGVAPQAKINQQRSRRYKSASARKSDQIFDTNAITPGTEFMKELDQYFRAELRRVDNARSRGQNTRETNALPPRIVYSSHMVPGEGEHKIADELRAMVANNQTIVVHGADADLMMIYLLRLEQGWKNIYLFRESNDERNRLTLVRLHEIHFTQDGEERTLPGVDGILQRTFPDLAAPLDDFVILIFLIGNDFLPHFPSLERVYDALDYLVASYREYVMANPGQGLSDGHGIVWENLSAFLDYFVENYDGQLLDKWAQNVDNAIPYPLSIVETCMTQSTQISGTKAQCVREFDQDKFRQEWYQYIFSPKGLNTLITPTEEDITNMCLKYLEGMAWVYKYYHDGVVGVNVGWYYPYQYAPLLSDVARTLRTTLAESGSIWEREPTQLFGSFISPLEQMVMVLPPRSVKIVPAPLRVLYTETSSIYDLIPDGFLIDPQGKMPGRGGDIYQSIPILPIPQPLRVERAVQNLRLPKSFVDSYKAQEKLVLGNILDTLRRPTRPSGGTRGRGSEGYRGAPRGGGVTGGRASTYAERDAGRGGYSSRGDRGGYSTRGDRGGYSSRGTRGGYSSRGDRGGYSSRGTRGGYSGRGRPSPTPTERPPLEEEAPKQVLATKLPPSTQGKLVSVQTMRSTLAKLPPVTTPSPTFAKLPPLKSSQPSQPALVQAKTTQPALVQAKSSQPALVQSKLPPTTPVQTKLPPTTPVQTKLPPTTPVQSKLPLTKLPPTQPVLSKLPSMKLPPTTPVQTKLSPTTPVQTKLPPTTPVQTKLPPTTPVQTKLSPTTPVQTNLPPTTPVQTKLPPTTPVQTKLPPTKLPPTQPVLSKLPPAKLPPAQLPMTKLPPAKLPPSTPQESTFEPEPTMTVRRARPGQMRTPIQ